ncbi:hypothetical protein [Corallococcus terminator]|uniref:Uncharacterized protein n=1 Tax=Corallococcus terminator TaxID=2316733 RepID=A0A3A8H1A8_9BACT|nr:hypothetical protein [Corallococcus terminator]RKG64819.1 hypothetical protein D7V88_41975 [Corallococcus terminator]
MAKDLKVIAKANLGLRLEGGYWREDAFRARYDNQAYTRFPRAWLLRLGQIDVDRGDQRLLAVLYTLWNPAVDQLPYLSCRDAGRALDIDQGPASLRLKALPVSVNVVVA